MFSRLTKITLKHLEFDAVYVRERSAIELSRIQATKFLRTMPRADLLKVHQSSSWNEHAAEEAERLAAIKAQADAQARQKQEAKDAIVAAERALHEHAIRRARASLGIAMREPAQLAARGGNSGDAAGASASLLSAVSAPPAPIVISAVSPDGRRKTRKQVALEHERARFAQEEEGRRVRAAKKEAARVAAEEEAVTAASGPALDPFSPEEAQVYVEYVRKFATEFQEVYAEARKHMERIRRGEQMYQVLQKRMNNFIVDVSRHTKTKQQQHRGGRMIDPRFSCR